LRSTVEISGEITQTAALISVLQDIVARLVAELRRLQRQVMSVELVFHHSRRPATRETLQLIEPTHEAQRLLGPLTIRLERLTLPAPVIAFGVTAFPVEAHIEEAELFDEPALGRNSAPAALVERLRARFGIERVYGVELVEDHRPERVWARRAERLFQASAPSASPSLGTARPLWILPSPVRLPAAGAEIYGTTFAKALSEEGVPERIESGWWDGSDIGRDYYAIRTGRGQRLWIYKDHATRGWYLHGLFG
jgi:protein ImuB